MKEIKAVIFDMGSVLTNDGWPKVYKKIADHSGLSKEKVEEICMPILREWSVGGFNEGVFWKKFEEKSSKKISAIFADNFWYLTYKKWTKDIAESWEIVKELRAKGVRLALLSNTIDPHLIVNQEIKRVERLKKIGFDTFVWSNKVGFRKPDPKIFEIILDKLKLTASECVFVDDVRSNVEAAEKLGFKSIQFKSPALLREKLKDLGLL